MPKPLKIYIAGVVTLSALALGVATLVFPADPRVSAGVGVGVSPTIQTVLGVSFWTVGDIPTSNPADRRGSAGKTRVAAPSASAPRVTTPAM